MKRMKEIDGARLVAPLMIQGKNGAQIAAELGIGAGRAFRYVARAREMGLAGYVGRSRWHSMIKNMPIGTLRESFNSVDAEVVRWIVENTPNGATVAEFLIACAVDQYHDEAGE